MTHSPIRSDRRTEPRTESDDVMRWKRPGRMEDHKAWLLDRSSAGLGFLTVATARPCVGEILNIRRVENDVWTTIDRTVRVARTTPTSSDDLIMVGCTIR